MFLQRLILSESPTCRFLSQINVFYVSDIIVVLKRLLENSTIADFVIGKDVLYHETYYAVQ